MADNDSEAPKVVKEPKLFKILCCPVDTKKGQALVQKLHLPYLNNTEDSNIIIGIVDFSNLRLKIFHFKHKVQFARRGQENYRCKEWKNKLRIS